MQTPSREPNIGNLADPDSTVEDVTRPYQSFAGLPLFNSDTPIADDVNQGAVGDCYFMAPISAVAKRQPHQIRNSVADLGDGTFAVRLRRDGNVRFVRVDADLPVNRLGAAARRTPTGRPAAARCGPR